MKSVSALLVAGAALAAAQSLGDLPPCGQTCVSNMLAIAQSQFGCAVGNVTCYCTNQNFGYGVRDCSEQSCPSPQQAQSVIAFGLSYCASALKTVTGQATGSSTTAATTTTTGGGKSAGSVTTTTVASTATGALASATAHISAVKASPGVFVVGKGHTISAGGPVYSSKNGFIYTAARSDVLVHDASETATVVPSAVYTTALSSPTGPTTTKPATTTTTTNGKGGPLAGATSGVESVTKGVYVVDASHTISVGGKPFSTAGTVYSAGKKGVVIAAHGKKTTYDHAPKLGAKTTVTTGTTKTTPASSTTTAASSSPSSAASSSSSSSGLAPIATAAPGLLGAAALAILAF